MKIEMLRKVWRCVPETNCSQRERVDEWHNAHLVADEANRFNAYDSTGTVVIAGATDATLVHLISKGYVRVRMP